MIQNIVIDHREPYEASTKTVEKFLSIVLMDCSRCYDERGDERLDRATRRHLWVDRNHPESQISLYDDEEIPARWVAVDEAQDDVRTCILRTLRLLMRPPAIAQLQNEAQDPGSSGAVARLALAHDAATRGALMDAIRAALADKGPDRRSEAALAAMIADAVELKEDFQRTLATEADAVVIEAVKATLEQFESRD